MHTVVNSKKSNNICLFQTLFYREANRQRGGGLQIF